MEGVRDICAPVLTEVLAAASASDRALLASHWGCSQWPNDPAAQVALLAQHMANPALVTRRIAELPASEQQLLAYLCAGGNLPMPLLEQVHGALRFPPDCVSPRAYLANLATRLSPLEQLFLTGLVFVVQIAGQRHVVLSTDVQPLLASLLEPALPVTMAPPYARHASLRELEWRIVTWLALAQANELALQAGGALERNSLQRLARRWGYDATQPMFRSEERWHYARFLRLTLEAAGLLRATAAGQLRPTAAAGRWLQLPRSTRLQHLLTGWAASAWNELSDFLAGERRSSPDLVDLRHALLDLLATLPAGNWLAISDLAARLRWREPELMLALEAQLPPGIALSELVHACLILGPRWLAIADIGHADDALAQPMAIRLTEDGAAALGSTDIAAAAPQSVAVQANFEILVPPDADLLARFQISRIADLKTATSADEVECYRLTRASVLRAARQGITAAAITRFLSDAAVADLPEHVLDAVQEWAGSHGQVHIERGAVLHAESDLLLERLQRDRRLRLPPYTRLDAQTWLLSEGDAAALLAALQRAGYGIAGDIETAGSLQPHELAQIAAALRFYAAACAHLGIETDNLAGSLRQVERLLDTRRRDTAAANAAAALDALIARLEDRS